MVYFILLYMNGFGPEVYTNFSINILSPKLFIKILSNFENGCGVTAYFMISLRCYTGKYAHEYKRCNLNTGLYCREALCCQVFLKVE